MEELNIRLRHRILIIGSPGTGKSTLSKILAKKLRIKCHHLDDLYWLRHWRRPRESDWVNKLHHLIHQEEWIIEGNYYRNLDQRLSRANFVIYLDYPTYLCVYRVIKRAFIRCFICQDSLPCKVQKSKNKKIKVKLGFARFVLFFKLTHKKKMLTLLNRHNVDYLTVKSPRNEIDLLKHITIYLTNKAQGYILCH